METNGQTRQDLRKFHVMSGRELFRSVLCAFLMWRAYNAGVYDSPCSRKSLLSFPSLQAVKSLSVFVLRTSVRLDHFKSLWTSTSEVISCDASSRSSSSFAL